MKIMQPLGLFLLIIGCNSQPYSDDADIQKAGLMHRSVKKLTDVIVHDIISPPVASRMYVYPSIAAYEVTAKNNKAGLVSLAGQLADFKGIPDPPDGDLCYPCASIKAFLDVSKHLVFSEYQIEEFELSALNEMKQRGVPDDVFVKSIAYGESVAKEIITWADKDGYNESRKLPLFQPSSDADKWKPTPPDFMDAIEPHWNTLRPFVIEQADQFIPEPPTTFDINDEQSKFYKELLQVYNAVDEGENEKEEIARFWDCNPFAVEHKGHLMLGSKKITPGGHWIGITSLACRKAELNFSESTEAYALVSISLADAFISCWDEKYRSNLIRPETVINTYLDPNWEPILTTPPFPEHTSGHSVVSTAAALTLTQLMGDNFSFNDSVEVEFGLPVRSFASFRDASEEAAISRLYGGIHYMPAITEGVKQGEKVANFIIDNLQTRKDVQ